MGTWTREWVGAETRLLSEWLVAFHPTATVHLQAPLGPVDLPPDSPSDSPAYLRMLGRYRRKADAVVIYPASVILVEAAILPDPGKMGQLMHYRELFAGTPEFEDVAGRPLTALLLVAQDDATVRNLAARQGFAWQVFCPNWVSAYLVERLPRRNRSSTS